MMTEPAADLWLEWSEGRLSFQACQDCQATQHPPAQVCGTCHSTSLHLLASDGRATLISWSTVHRAPSAEFKDQVPYTIGLVSLPDGAFIEARVDTGISPDGWMPGLPAILKLGQINGRTLPVISHVGGHGAT